MLGANKQLKADLMLILVTLCWGVSYFLMDICLGDMDPFTLNAHRFIGAFVIAAALSWKKIKTINKITLKYSILLGVLLVIVYIGATFGVKYTTLSNSGFLCALTVVFTPMIARIFLKQKQEKKVVIAVIICFIGIALLTLKDDFSVNTENLIGDLMCVMCALSYAVVLLLTEKAVSHEAVDAYQLGVFQIGFTGVFNLIIAFMLEQPHLPTTGPVWASVIFLSIFCTGVAYVVQPIAQQYTTASHTGVIFAMEPVFASVVAVVFANEILTTKSYLGAFLMMISFFIMETDFKKLLNKKQI
ncbi:MAG: DMT family transporter [Firmicutes bacterium]|nr:DMT family transporter [Bacillota bacterium]